jgi:hypothetical protein
MEFTMELMTREARGTLAYAEKHGEQLVPVVEELEHMDCGLIRAVFWASDLSVSISGTAHQFGLAWGFLRGQGFKCENERPKPKESAWSGFFTNPTTQASIFVTFASTQCQRVQVGTRTEEVPVYEVQCGEVAP